MGLGCSFPLPPLPSDDYMAIGLYGLDSLILMYAGQAEIDAVRLIIVQTWNPGIQKEEPRLVDENTGTSRCYKFKFRGNPFTIGNKMAAVESRRMATMVLHSLYNLGWKLLVSSDLSRIQDLTTWIFQKQALQPCHEYFFNIGISSYDKLQINDCPQHLHDMIRSLCHSIWKRGIQDEKTVSSASYEIRFNGNPWQYVDKEDSCLARHMLKEIIQKLSGRQWLLYGNSNLKSTADTLFFQHVPVLQGEQEFLTVSLNKTDRLRLIHTPSFVITALEETVRQNWSKGIQDIIYDSPLCFEMKLGGTPWWGTGDETVTSRLLIVKILERLSSIGYFVITGIDISRKLNDKSLLLFRRGAPLNTKFFCLSLNETDKIRLLNAPQNVMEAGKRVISQWTMGVQEEKYTFDNVSYQVKLKGNPWSHMHQNDGIHGRALLLGLLNTFTSLGWRLVCSADISAKYIRQDKGPDYPLDVHSWYFMYDEIMLYQMPSQQQAIYQNVLPTAPFLYPALAGDMDAPPSYEEATGTISTK